LGANPRADKILASVGGFLAGRRQNPATRPKADLGMNFVLPPAAPAGNVAVRKIYPEVVS
jgi:hypothetical protein